MALIRGNGVKMQSTIGCITRIVSRSFVSAKSNEQTSPSTKERARLLTAVSGFPKQKSGYNIDNILKGQIGDDAYFIARHVDDWSFNNNNNSIVKNSDPGEKESESVEQLLNPNSTSTIPRSPALRPNNSADVIGVADGVGGWRQYGVDPGQFSTHLMKTCERLVRAGYFISNQPARLLAHGFREMQECKKPVIGSSTACLMMLCHEDCKIYTANIGDSGFLVVRHGKIVHRSQEQQHYFNTPFQLSLPPSEMASDVLSDLPESADRYEFGVQDGDVIIMATDGIFDNVPDSLLVAEINTIQGSTDPAKIQACANSIALIARKLSQDPNFLSPFARSARSSGFHDVVGGKEDDITVLLAAVRLGASSASASTSCSSDYDL